MAVLPNSRSAPGLFTKLREVGKPRFPQASSGKGGNCGPRRRASAVATSLDLQPHHQETKEGPPRGMRGGPGCKGNSGSLRHTRRGGILTVGFRTGRMRLPPDMRAA
jgi:hypothetical protein